MSLFSLAIINVFTKEVATISGCAFTITFFIVFEASRLLQPKAPAAGTAEEHEKFRLDTHADVSAAVVTCASRQRAGGGTQSPPPAAPGAHPAQDGHAQDGHRGALGALRSRRQARGNTPWTTGQIFSDAETEVFTRVVTLAEKAGKHVELMVVPGADPYDAVVQTAARLQSSRIVMGLSPKLTPSEQGAQVGVLLGATAGAAAVDFARIVLENQKDIVFFNLGPHPPRLWPEDIDLVAPAVAGGERKGPGSKIASSRHGRGGAAANGAGIALGARGGGVEGH